MAIKEGSMAIGKNNRLLQITLPKQDLEQLNTIVEAFNAEGIKCTKSDIMVTAFRGYVKLLVANGLSDKQLKVAEPQGEKKDA